MFGCSSLVFIFSFLFAFASAALSCPNGAFSWKSNCYLFIPTPSGFAKAEIICQKYRGHLTSIHDAFTNAAISQNAPFVNLTTFWIGATSLNSPNIWEWTDGTNFDFTDWPTGEPSNKNLSSCASVSMKNGYWKAENCYYQKPFVCQIANKAPILTTMTPLITEKMTISSSTYQSTDAPTLPLTSSKTKSSSTITVTSTTIFPSTSSSTISQTPTTSTSFPSTNSPFSTKNCSNGWNYFEKTDSCYFLLFNEARTWNESENQCNSYGAHLTSIHSEEESIFVNRTLSNFFGTSPYRCTEIWIGLYSNDNKTTWKWTDNSPLGDYLPWWPGYPASFYGNCAVLGDFCPHRVLSNLFCDVKRYSVCKKAA